MSDFNFTELKPASVKARIGFYKSLKINDIDDIHKLNDTNAILKRVYDTEALYTRSTRLYYIKKLIEKYPHKVDDGIQSFYADLSSLTKMNLLEVIKDNSKSDKDNKRMLGYKHLNKILKTKLPDIKNHVDLSAVDFAALLNKLQDYIIIKIYLENPIRNNLSNLVIIDHLDQATNDELNYIVINKNQVIIILNKFKNSDAFGQSRVVFTNALDAKIRYFIKLKNIFDDRYIKGGISKSSLFYHISSKKLEPLSSDSMVHKVKDISNKFFGVPISINDYRRIWETRLMKSQKYLKMTNEERDLQHRRIQHGTAVAINNYNKV